MTLLTITMRLKLDHNTVPINEPQIHVSNNGLNQKRLYVPTLKTNRRQTQSDLQNRQQ